MVELLLTNGGGGLLENGGCECNINNRGPGIDNPQVQGIIVAISKGGSDKYGVSNPQGDKGKINILSSPICH